MAAPADKGGASVLGFVFLAALFLVVPACSSFAPLSEVALRPSNKGSPADEAPQHKPPAGQSPDGDHDSQSPIEAQLAGRWWRATSGSLESATVAYCWRHEGVERLIQAADTKRLREASASADAAVRAPAAIALARLKQADVAALLAAAIDDENLETNLRCAAVEALAGLVNASRELALDPPAASQDQAVSPAGITERDKATIRSTIAELVGRVGAGDPPQPGYQPALHAELLTAAATTRIPVDEQLLAAALASRSPEVRAAAVACCAARERPLPPRAIDLRSDPDLAVRMAAVRAIARRRPPDTMAMLSEALRDPDLRLRLATIHELGNFDPAAGGALLGQQLKDPAELVRAAAVEALAKSGDWQAVHSAGGDPSWRVRKVVAACLARCPTDESARLAEQLLRDQSPDVEHAVVDAVACWPLERAAPLLLSACDHLAPSTRQRAADKLAALWPPAKEFSPTAPSQRRAEMLAELRAKLAAEMESRAGGVAASATVAAPAGPDVPISQRDRVRQLVVALANEKSPDLIRRQLQALSGYGAALVPLLEQIAVEEKLYLREDIYSEVLPPLDPAFQALALLRSGDVNQRRSASNRLANEFQEHPPSALALTRLAQLMPGESDAVVWLNLWRALFDRDDEPLCELAYVGLEHAVPEVRRQSCQYLGRHPAPRHAAALMRAIDDPAPEVARAATEALGHCGPLADRRRLAQALASRDPGLRFAAAVSLARLDDESGRAALERFTYEGDSDLRRETAQAMGQVADKRFIPALIRLLDDRDSVRLAALVALGAIAGGERIQEPAERSLSLDEQARRWQNWWRAKQQQGD